MTHQIVIAGATGLVGGVAVRYALDAGHRVAALVRAGRSASLAPLATRGLAVLEVDFERLDACRDEIARLAPGSFLCALGTTIKRAGSQAAFAKVDRDHVLSFARLGRAAGARHFGLVTSVGADPRSSALYLRVKGEAEEGVKALSFARVDIARPSFLIGTRSEARPSEGWGVRASTLLTPLLVGGLRAYRPIAASVVARALVNLSTRPEPGPFVHTYDGLVAAAG